MFNNQRGKGSNHHNHPIHAQHKIQNVQVKYEAQVRPCEKQINFNPRN